MVKRILLTLDDDQFNKLEALKGGETWEQFLVTSLLKKASG